MVILIGGAGYTGKTTMAQKLLEIYKIPYFSIDHLKMGIFRSNNNCGFNPESPDKIITDKLWPIIKGIIKTNIENDQNIIIEGCYFPESIEDIGKEYLNKIIMFSMGFSEQYIRKNLYSGIFEKRNILEKRMYEEEAGDEFIENIEEYIMKNKNRKEICIKNKIKHFEINENYEMEIKNIFKWIENEVKRKK
ncbi:MAG TPA: 2-phosphoglycerate kinase [Treponema sp.]|nr:2-phosphoglycerate kinase [Treponema sp.]